MIMASDPLERQDAERAIVDATGLRIALIG
jgi:hypothetical protein